jgi:hypothetical protein
MLRVTAVGEAVTTCSELTLEQWFTKCEERATSGAREDSKVCTPNKKLLELHLLSDELRCERKLGFFNDFWLDFLGMN